MRCPKCNTALYDYPLDAKNTIDLCSQCRGMWLKAGVLANSCKADQDLPDPSFSYSHSKETRLACPKCNTPGTKLVTFPISNQQRTDIDYCMACKGIWLDQKELPLVQAEVKKAQQTRLKQGHLTRDPNSFELLNLQKLFIRQTGEPLELLGFETRNRYAIFDEHKNAVGFLSEQGKGVGSFLMRQVFGHWRPFHVHILSASRAHALTLNQPFRFWFKRMELRDPSGVYIGAIQRRFSIFHKYFVIEDAQGSVTLQVKSPLYRIWTFVFTRHGIELARLTKRFSGLLTELFTDRDNFAIEFKSQKLTEDERRLILAAAVFIDLSYFELHKN
jgi:Zn-finger nucleic acid-binding protein/uncharacterized protein YxjI